MSNLTKYKMETVISFNDDEPKATLYTCNKAWIHKMDKLCQMQPDTFKHISQDQSSKTYSFSKKLVSIRKPKIYTDEQLEKSKENGKRLQLILRRDT